MTSRTSNYFKIVIFTTLCLLVIQFSCNKQVKWQNYDELEVVRTSRDSSYYFNGKLHEGLIKKLDENGQVFVKFSTKKGKLNGNYTKFYVSGNYHTKANYLNGELHGEFKTFFDNNILKEKIQYTKGLINGKRILYWQNGSIKESSILRSGVLTGECLFYYSNSNLRKKISFNEFGNRQGEWIDFFSNGNIKQKVIYSNGNILDPILKYDINGNPIK